MEALRRARHVGWDVAAGPTSVGTPPAFPKMGTHCRGNYQRAAPLAAFPLVLLWEEIKLWGQGGETCERPSALGRGHFCPSICSGADRTEPSLGPVCTRRPFKFVHGLTVLPFARMGIVILSGQPRTPPRPPPPPIQCWLPRGFCSNGEKGLLSCFRYSCWLSPPFEFLECHKKIFHQKISVLLFWDASVCDFMPNSRELYEKFWGADFESNHFYPQTT